MNLVQKLFENQDLTDLELKEIIETNQYDQQLFQLANEVRKHYYGTDVYLRGLIELSNICRNDCYYCGIRKGNTKVNRYRLSKEDILACCENGYHLGFRTFVLQGGEDGYYNDEVLCSIITEIRQMYPDCAITLSLGERSYESYKACFEAGANRYLLRHETANEEHYKKLHPECLSSDKRKRCLMDLKEIGYQVGSGFMVGSPYQTTDHLIEDLRFLQALKPDMIGIGPFISHGETPFHDFENGNLDTTLRMIAILRLMFPNVLIPSTTALGTIHPQGRELGLQAGANVVMPNLSPVRVRKLYELYDNIVTDIGNVKVCKTIK